MINTLKDDYSIRLLCEALDVHRCNLYHRSPPGEDRQMKEALMEQAGAWPTYGYRRLTVMLRRQGLKVNEKRVRRLMHELGIVGKAPERKPRTTLDLNSGVNRRRFLIPVRLPRGLNPHYALV